jgi:peroxidase
MYSFSTSSAKYPTLVVICTNHFISSRDTTDIWPCSSTITGGHTLGTSHCSSFSDRLYNFSGTMMPDPSLDKFYLPRLKSKCRDPSDRTTLVEIDPGSFRTFDASYYRLIAKRRSLFTSDQTLMDDPFTRAYVQRQAAVADAGAYPAEFFSDFEKSMVKMGNMQVLTGSQGEVRRHCAFVN